RLSGLHEKEVADLVNEMPAEAKKPVDPVDRPANGQVREASLFRHLAHRRGFRRFATFEMALGKSPILIAVANEQKQRSRVVETKHDAAGRRLVARKSPDVASHQAEG